MASDAYCMGRLVNGDGEAARELIDRHRRPLLALLRRALGPVPEVDDAFQNIWMRVVRSAARYDPIQRFDRWLFMIAWNVVKDEWKRSGRAGQEPLSTDLRDLQADAEASAIRSADARKIRMALRELPEKMSEVVLLRYFEDLTEAECADQLRVPVGTVKSRAHHALLRLREILEEEPHGSTD